MLDRILGYEREKRVLGNVGSLPIVRAVMPGKKGGVLVAIVTVILSLEVARLSAPGASTVILGNCGRQYIGFNGPRWTGSETLQYIRGNPVAGEIYSNVPWPLALHIGNSREQARFQRLPGSRTALERSAEWHPDGAHVIWFHDYERFYDYGLASLKLLFPDLKPAAELADGIVFKVNRDGAPRSNP